LGYEVRTSQLHPRTDDSQREIDRLLCKLERIPKKYRSELRKELERALKDDFRIFLRQAS